MLRYAKGGSVQNPPRQLYIVSDRVEGPHQFLQKCFVSANGQPFYIFEHKRFGIEFGDDPDELKYKLVTRIF